MLETLMPANAYWLGSTVIAVSKVNGHAKDIAEQVLQKVHAINAKRLVEINILGCSVGEVLPTWVASRAFEVFSSSPSLIVCGDHTEGIRGCLTLLTAGEEARFLSVTFVTPLHTRLTVCTLLAHTTPLPKHLRAEVLERFVHCTVSSVQDALEHDDEDCVVSTACAGVPSRHAVEAVSALHSAAMERGCMRAELLALTPRWKEEVISTQSFIATAKKSTSRRDCINEQTNANTPPDDEAGR